MVIRGKDQMHTVVFTRAGRLLGRVSRARMAARAVAHLVSVAISDMTYYVVRTEVVCLTNCCGEELRYGVSVRSTPWKSVLAFSL